MNRFFGLMGLLAFALAACGGGGGSSPSPTIGATATATPTSSPVITQSQTVTTSTTAPVTNSYALTGYTNVATFPAASASTTLATTFSTGQPAGTPTIQMLSRRPQSIGASAIGAIAFLCVTPAATVSFGAYPSFNLTVPAGLVTAGSLGYVALFDPTKSSAGWTTIEGPATLTGSTFAFTGTTAATTLQAGQTSCLLFFTVASALPTPSPSPTPTPLPNTVTQSVALATTGSAQSTFAINGYTSTVTFGSATADATLSATFATTLPNTTPALQSVRRVQQSLGLTPSATANAYLCITPSTYITLTQYPSFNFTVAPAAFLTAAATTYVAMYNPVAGQWAELDGPGATVQGNSGVALSGPAGSPELMSGQTYCFAFFTLASALPSPSAIVTTAASVPAWMASQHTGYVAIGYGGNPPMHIGIYAPGQTTASTTLTYASCCIWQIQFDSHGNLLASTTNDGVLTAAPGATALSSYLPAQGGFSMVDDALGDVAVGGYNMGSTVAVYPGGTSSALLRVPGGPGFQGLALSPRDGELAVGEADGSVNTYPRGSTTANRTLALGLLAGGGSSDAVVAYDSNGNLAVGSANTTTVGVYAPGATTPTYTISGVETQSMAFDSLNRLIIGENNSIAIYPAGSTTASVVLGGVIPEALTVDAYGTIALSQFGSGLIYGANGQVVSLYNTFQSDGIAISP